MEVWFFMKMGIVSVDVEEDLHLDLQKKKTFNNIEEMHELLATFANLNIRATLFVTGDVIQKYPDDVKEWSKKHEIGCHSRYHIPINFLSLTERENDIMEYLKLYRDLFSTRPEGYRAVQNIIDWDQIQLIEKSGFVYDSSIIEKIPVFRIKQLPRGSTPPHPYHPNETNYLSTGKMKLWEIPISSSPFVHFPLYGTWIRYFGPSFFKALYKTSSPPFFHIAMHSWDCYKFKGKYSKYSGKEFLAQLDSLISYFHSDYTFLPCRDIVNMWSKQNGKF
jgi:peptidoglycan/xylan/chitin deacetylase (PgdA/CDA1 family)